MKRDQRRGARPRVTSLLSERRVPGGRVFVFEQDGLPVGASLGKRAFSWDADHVAPDASADAGKQPAGAAGQPAGAANDADFAGFLRGIRAVYRGGSDST